MGTSKTKESTQQLSFAEIAAQKQKLADQQKALDEQLAAAKESEFGKLSGAVVEFNSAFATKYELKEPSRSVGNGAKRNCGKCHQPGHRAKNCPTVQPAAE